MIESLSSRWAQDDDDVQIIFALLEEMHAEVAHEPLCREKALANVAATVKAGLARMVFDGEELVGTFGLWNADWWYSESRVFLSQWIYVAKSHRLGSGVLRCMLNDVIDLVEESETEALLHFYERPDRRMRSRVACVAEELGVLPSGRILAINRTRE
jgi:hypothetical protein